MIKGTDTVVVTITLNREVDLTESADALCKLMGVDLDTLNSIIEDGADWEPEDDTLSAMADQGDVTEDEWDWTDMYPVD